MWNLSLCLLLVAAALLAGGAEASGEKWLPNLDQMQFGFNVLRGQPPDEQRKTGAQEELFSFRKGSSVTLNGVTYDRPLEVSDYSATFECFWRGTSNDVAWANSASSLSWQSKSSSTGFDQTTTIGVSVPVEAVEVSAETTIRNALVFGNSQTSSESFSQQNYGRTYTYDGNGASFLYMSEIDWNDVATWSSDLTSAASALGSSPSDAQLIGFIQRFGTHGLKRAQFGQKCMASVFIKEGKTMSEYTEFMQTDKTAEMSLWWFSSSSSSSEGSSSETTNAEGFKYVTSDRRCIGSLKGDSNCGEGLKGNGVEDRPGLNEVNYMPMWDMPMPGLSSGAKSKMKDLVSRMMGAQAECGRQHCSGKGVCAAELALWYSQSEATSKAGNLQNFWDGDKCFCNDDRVGSRCETAREVKLETASYPGSPQNDWDSDLNYRLSKPLCGVRSQHDNGREDRRFTIGSCDILEPGYRSGGSEYQLAQTFYDAKFQRECPGNMALTGMWSRHSNGAEDRYWKFYCRQFEQTALGSCSWDGSYLNDYDRPVDKTCRTGQVLAGVHGVHSNGPEDRRWKYKCCSLVIDKNVYFATREEGPTGWLNSWDKAERYEAKVSGKYAAISGVESYHDNGPEDRRWKFWARTSVNWPSRGSTRYLGETNWDGYWTKQCNADEALVKWDSDHDNGREDRKFKFWCAKFSGVKIDQCYWSDYDGSMGSWTTSYDAHWTYRCAPDFVLSGVQSKHDNGPEDRVFNFKCCRFRAVQSTSYLAAEAAAEGLGEAEKEEEAAGLLSGVALPLTIAVAVLVACSLAVAAAWRCLRSKGRDKIWDVELPRYGGVSA